MGNICRSPAAHGIMQKMLLDAGLENLVHVDSAGTINLHAGKLPDSRMRKAAGRRGYPLSHPARQVRPSDLDDFDLVLVMDLENLADVEQFADPQKHEGKLRLFCEFCTAHDETEVPDPYHSSDAGFEFVLDLLEDGCAELLRRIQSGSLLDR